MCSSAAYLITSLPVVGKLLSEISDDEERESSSFFGAYYDLAVSGEPLIVTRSRDVLFYQLN